MYQCRLNAIQFIITNSNDKTKYLTLIMFGNKKKKYANYIILITLGIQIIAIPI